MDTTRLRLRCACGWEVVGTEPEIVAAATEHGRRVHNMTPTRDEVLAMILRDDPDDPEAATDAPGGLSRTSERR